MRWQEISEAPIELHNLDYPGRTETAPNSFQRDDQYLLNTPKHIERAKKVWHSSVCDVIAYFVDMGVQPDMALDYAQYGHDLAGGGGDKARLADLHIEGTPGKITMIFTNNEGTNRIPMTGWIIAHRMLHAFAFYRSGTISRYHREIPALADQLEKIGKQVTAELRDIRGSFNDKLSLRDIAEMLGSTRACRERKLNVSNELFPECFAQYILKGKVTFRELPEAIQAYHGDGEPGETYTCYQGNLSAVNRWAKNFETWLNTEIPHLIDLAKGHVFAL
jgi:hypothetical protein